MSTSDDAPLELPCCEAGKEAAPDPCPWHPGEIKLPAAGPTEETSKEIVERVFREMGIDPGRPVEKSWPRETEKEASVDFPLEDLSPDAAEILLGATPYGKYRPPEKPVPYLGDRMVIPWGVIILFTSIASVCAFLIGWSLSELGIV